MKRYLLATAVLIFASSSPSFAGLILCEKYSPFDDTELRGLSECLDAHKRSATMSGWGFIPQEYKDPITDGTIVFIKRRSMLPIECNGYKTPQLTVQCTSGVPKVYILGACDDLTTSDGEDLSVEVRFAKEIAVTMPLLGVADSKFEFANPSEMLARMLSNRDMIVRYSPDSGPSHTMRFILNGKFTQELNRAIEPYSEICGL